MGTLIPGAEISATYPMAQGQSIVIHILALFCDRQNAPALHKICTWSKSLNTSHHSRAILEKLNQCGVPIAPYKELAEKLGYSPRKHHIALEVSCITNLSVEEVHNRY